jgi:hypothetical protein
MSGLGLSFDPVTSTVNHIQMTTYRNLGDANCPGTSTPGPMVVNHFSPTTGVIIPSSIPYHQMVYNSIRVTGKDGALYTVSRKSPWIGKFNGSSWDILVGTGILGNCDDGTPAISCNIDPQDLYVTAQGKLYFIDKGRIRTVNDSGNVITLMGQSYYYGDGGPALSARFNSINYIEQRNSGEIILLDQFEFRFREFSIGGNINAIAGNGNLGIPNLGVAATTQSIFMNYAKDNFKINPATGDVFFTRSTNRIGKLNRTTGFWEDLVGTGANLFTGADGLAGSSIKLNSYATNEPRVLGFDGTSIMAYVGDRTSAAVHTDGMFKTYTIANGTQGHVAGVPATIGSFCNTGTPTATCVLPGNASGDFDSVTYDSTGNRWLIHQASSLLIRSLNIGGNVGILVTLPSVPSSFAYRRTGGSPAEYVYYCSTTDGKLHKNDLTTDTALAWPITSLQCAGRRLIYNSSTNSLIFIYKQNGLMGIAEYLNP